jgi:hypothetical protein
MRGTVAGKRTVGQIRGTGERSETEETDEFTRNIQILKKYAKLDEIQKF